LVKTLGLNLAYFLRGVGILFFTLCAMRYALCGLTKREWAFVFRLTPYPLRLSVKRVKVDEISERER